MKGKGSLKSKMKGTEKQGEDALKEEVEKLKEKVKNSGFYKELKEKKEKMIKT